MMKKAFLTILSIVVLIVGYNVYANISSTNSYLINVCKNNKWGYINKSGKQIIPFKYDLPSEFSEDLASACVNNKCGFIDKTGKEVIPLKYDAAYSFSKGLAPVEIGEKWGYINKLNKVVIPFEYMSPESYTEGLAPLCKDFQLCGYVNKKNETKIPFKYSDVTSFEHGYAAVKSAGLWGLINKEGKEIIPLNYSSFGSPTEGLMPACLPEDNGEGYKCGFIDIKNKVVIPFKYIWNDGFSDGLAAVQGENENWSFINKQGEKAFNNEYFS